MKLLVDGVFFQLTKSGIARVWSSILPRLAKYPDIEITILDRGNSPRIDGIGRIEFPSYKMDASTAADSFLIERFCKEIGTDIFISTYYTTPVTVPSVLVVYDMIPEVLDFDLGQRAWLEKQIAINYASSYACISELTRQELERFYPGTIKRSIVAHCAVDGEIFRPRDPAEVQRFKTAFNISRPYYLLVGSREQHLGYKNGALIFKAAESIKDREFEIVCVGGEPQIAPGLLAALPANVSVRRIELADVELACAYSGAEALVYPSLYEGFGMPVIEAMASACPVITTNHGALGEIAGDAAFFVTGYDAFELRGAMSMVRDSSERDRYIEKGLAQAGRFDWDATAQKIYDLVKVTFEEEKSPRRIEFQKRWEKLRALQAAVDPS